MAVTNFIPTLWSARLLEHLDKNHVYVNLLNRDYEGEIRSFGDTVKINQIGDIEIKNYTKNADIAAPDALSGSQLELKINQAKYYNFAIDDVDNAQTNPKLMNDAMQRAAYALADTSDSYAAGILVAGAAGTIGSDDTPVSLTATNAYDNLVDMATVLTEQNVPTQGRWVVIPAWVHGLLLKDQRFVSFGTSENKDTLENGLVGRAAGFDIHVSNNVPNTSGAKYKIVAGTNQGGSYAEQVLETKAYQPEARFADAIKGLHVYGAKVVQPDALVVLTADKA